MATVAAPSSDGPVLKLLCTRLRLLRKRRTRITQMEQRVAQGKVLNSDQEEILKSKPVVTALIEELENLRSAAHTEDLSTSPVASKSAPEKPSLDVVAAAAGHDIVAATVPVPESVTEPVPETHLQVDTATTDSQQKDEVDANTRGNITTAPQEEQKPETVGQQQNQKQKDGRRGYQNGRSGPGGRGGRGGYYHINQEYPRYVEYQNRGEYCDNGYNQRDFDYENDRGRYYDSGYYPRGQYYNPGYRPRYYQNAGGEYNDQGYYSRNSYNTTGRGTGRGGGYANQAPNVASAEPV